MIGTPPLPWQRHVMDVAGEIDAAGVPIFREVRVTVPRQQGKTGGLLLPIQVHRALAFGRPQRILYTAQDRNHAREKWSEQVEQLERSPLRRLFTVRRSNGSEAIRWRGGSVGGITASGEKSAHGFTLDLGVIDEAFAQTDDRLIQSFRPAMVTRRDAQLWIVSTAGTDESTFLRERVDDGRARVEAGERADVAYFEWSAPDDMAVDDPATWRMAMPALGALIDEETIRRDMASMDEAEFGRAYLNRWAAGGTPVFDLADWTRCRDDASKAESVAFGLDVSPDRRTASIAVAGGRRDGRVHVELIERRAGTDWIVARLGELIEAHKPAALAVDPGSPAGSLVTDITRLRRVPPLVLVTGRQYAAACGSLYDDVSTGRLAHRGQPALDDAVIAARRRAVGDSWVWARPEHAATDPAPLIAATLARYAWSTVPRVVPTIF